MNAWKDLISDLCRYGGNTRKPIGFLMGFLSFSYKHPACWAVIFYRLGRCLKSIPVFGVRHFLLFIYYTTLYPWARFILGVEIPLSCNIGPGLTIYHYGGIIFGGGLVAGKNLSLNTGVMIGRRGSNSEEYLTSLASIGDNVTIHAHSVVLCKCIGDGAIIGAGSVVIKDVEPYTVVAGNPAQKIKDLPTPRMA